MNKLDYLWIIPISLAIIGFFGIFWTLSLANPSIDINMDNETKESIISLSDTMESMTKVMAQHNTMRFNSTDCIWNNDKQEFWCINPVTISQEGEE